MFQVDGVDLRNATHDLAVNTFRNSGNPVKMVIQRMINRNKNCDVTTQTYGVAFAVTGDKDDNELNKKATSRSFQNNKSRWLTPHEIADSVNLSCSDEGVELVNQQNADRNKDEHKLDFYDSAYDTLLTQKSLRMKVDICDSGSGSNTVQTTTSPESSDTQGVVLRKKVNKDDNSEKRHSTFYVIPGCEENNNATPEKVWEDVPSGIDDDAEYEYEYEVRR